MGLSVICPHKNTALFDGELPPEVWLRGDMTMLARCDAIVRIPGKSEGADAEMNFAKLRGIQRFWWSDNVFDVAAIELWAKTGETR